MKSTFALRVARSESLEQILLLFRAYQAHYSALTSADEVKTRLFLSELLAKPEAGLAVIAESQGNIVGFATGFVTVSGVLAERLVHIGDLYVVPEHRRQGIATALIERVTEEARARGFGLVRWLSVAANTELNQWYASLGTTNGDFKLFLKSTGGK